MAFLDNSGDIILDAVLTDVGRRRMAQGDFNIEKFAIGDDEIDYALYNKDHPSGSAYYDLEILQTPVLEAFTQNNANINYGLTSYSQLDLLYLPTIKLNTLPDLSKHTVTLNPTVGVVYLLNADNTDSGGTTIFSHLKTDLGEAAAFRSCMISGDSANSHLLIETGIDNAELVPSQTNQASFLTSKGLEDSFFRVSYDTNLINRVLGPTPGSRFVNEGGTSGALDLKITLGKSEPVNAATLIGKYNDAQIKGITNRVYYDKRGADSVDRSTKFSCIAGPRGSFTAVGLGINPNISRDDFIKKGQIGVSQGSGASSKTYDLIDTEIYITGITTNVTIQIPIRIIQLATT